MAASCHLAELRLSLCGLTPRLATPLARVLWHHRTDAHSHDSPATRMSINDLGELLLRTGNRGNPSCFSARRWKQAIA
jgi:hypothetical protein